MRPRGPILSFSCKHFVRITVRFDARLLFDTTLRLYLEPFRLLCIRPRTRPRISISKFYMFLNQPTGKRGFAVRYIQSICKCLRLLMHDAPPRSRAVRAVTRRSGYEPLLSTAGLLTQFCQQLELSRLGCHCAASQAIGYSVSRNHIRAANAIGEHLSAALPRLIAGIGIVVLGGSFDEGIG
jgi:hypothetical protein